MDSKLSAKDDRQVTVSQFAKTEQGLQNLMNPELYVRIQAAEIEDWMMNEKVGLFVCTVPGFDGPQIFLSTEALRQKQEDG